ncbi:MAG: PilT/PilU family type 4a pilus ATPase [Phycisphaerales bacterium]|nr:MAG: PilT/PilU family type 4a pilus ATPase [Phycisphaerales bacterium]
MELTRLLEAMLDLGAGDLHLQAGNRPMVRLGGLLEPLEGSAELSDDEIREIVRQMAPGEVQVELDEERSSDFSFEMPGRARFRVNAFFERGHLSMALRNVPIEIPPFDELNLPHAIEEIAQTQRGLVLVTGTTGSGKSTTLAAMMDYVNTHRENRIITIEDPIEFVHRSKKCLVAQRELGRDTKSFAAALRVALRQDPDVILVGELRDAETMRTALQAADTGHAVYSTIHTTNASQTVQRMIALFPPEERELLVEQLAANLEAVISQRLARTYNGKDRIPVVEILRATPMVRKVLEKGEPTALPKAMASGEQGMQLFDQHLAKLWKAEIIHGTEALRLATNPEAISMIMHGLSTRDLETSLVG